MKGFNLSLQPKGQWRSLRSIFEFFFWKGHFLPFLFEEFSYRFSEQFSSVSCWSHYTHRKKVKCLLLEMIPPTQTVWHQSSVQFVLRHAKVKGLCLRHICVVRNLLIATWIMEQLCNIRCCEFDFSTWLRSLWTVNRNEPASTPLCYFETRYEHAWAYVAALFLQQSVINFHHVQ